MLEALVRCDRAGFSVLVLDGGGINNSLGRRSIIVAVLAAGVALIPDEPTGSPAILVLGPSPVASVSVVVAPVSVVAPVPDVVAVCSVFDVVPLLSKEVSSSLASFDGFFLVPTILLDFLDSEIRLD